MEIEIKSPSFPESISEGTIATWHYQPGDSVARDESLVDVETEKVVMEITAPTDGVLVEVLKKEGDVVMSEEIIGRMTSEAVVGKGAAAGANTDKESKLVTEASSDQDAPSVSPAARKLILEHNLDAGQVRGTGKDGRITKEDVTHLIQADTNATQPPATPAAGPAAGIGTSRDAGNRIERRVPMTRLRASIARRLLEATQNTAMLTTFNEVDMSAIMAMRKQYKEEFQQIHNGTRLGFMSFFVRAATEALRKFPMVNASLDGSEIVYHGYYDIGVAVGTDRGLVVPVLRNTDTLSSVQIEEQIQSYSEKAAAGKLTIDDMNGGTFTISNGGVYGSLLSTPILNLPQTAILGMHKIQERPVAVDGEVQIRPMMYLALSYDHRMIDGSEAVRFLVTIKNLLEQPARILLEL